MRNETDEEIARPVIGPVVEAVRARGVEVIDPRVLGAGANVVVHLAPSPIVARIATLAAEMRRRPGDYLARERHISAALAERGINVRDLPLRLGADDQGQPWSEIAELVNTVASTTVVATMDRVTEVVETLRRGEPDDSWQLVHGDAHRVNVAI